MSYKEVLSGVPTDKLEEKVLFYKLLGASVEEKVILDGLWKIEATFEKDFSSTYETTEEVFAPVDYGKLPLLLQDMVSENNVDELMDEYCNLFELCQVKQSKINEVNARFNKVIEGQEKYKKVASALGVVPWYFIGIIHMLESNFNFNAHLHNGDSLSRKTIHIPKNRPISLPPFSWEVSAIDAMKMQGFHKKTDWLLPNILYRFEKYNGFGYRKRKLPSPYLWSFSNIYTKGKYISDGEFSPDAISKQCGAAVMLRYMIDKNAINVT
jgi:lysozyme family protein